VGECPVWHAGERRLYWVDILEKKIHRFDPATAKNETFELPEIVPCIGLRAAGGLVLTLKKDFAFFDPVTGKLEKLAAVESDRPNNRFNDGKCDRQGRFWAGTMDSIHWDTPAGNLFRLDTERKAERMRSEVVCANGLDWSPDSRTMYFTESFRYEVFAYDFDPVTGAVANRRPFIRVEKASGGFPDGLTVDAEGFVWSCAVGIGEIRRYDPEGKLERTIRLPVSRGTSCAFGGEDFETLYITSSRETLKPEELRDRPLSGSLFAVETGVRGLPSTPYAG
jgi:sugar lactone lactonase YvrE